MTCTNSITILFFFFILTLPSSTHQLHQQHQQTTSAPLIPSFPTNTIPSPCTNTCNFTNCHLDLSPELFAGISSACSSLDRHRCCPVLAAWLFAAHAHSALSIVSSSNDDDNIINTNTLPISPDDSQKCVDSFHSSLASRNIHLPCPNSTCDTIICFCGIRLHHIQSLSCPAAFPLSPNLTVGNAVNATAAVHQLQKDCRNSSYTGCTRCLHSLQKIKGGRPAEKEDMTDRAMKMFNLDCQLMGLTWLLAKNKTAYIPTVSAVIRAIMYSSYMPTQQPFKCSPDQDNMPLAVDSMQIQKLDSSTAPAAHYSFTFAVVIVFGILV